MRLLFLGTSSGVGKTIMTAMFCRHLMKKGVRVAPFKASNLSSRHHVIENGGIIGTGQAFQSLVSGIVPTTDMNPILLVPGDNGIETFLNGKKFNGDAERTLLFNEALKAYDRLTSEFDAVIAEGSGSPAELNLMDRDIANMGLASERDIPCILVADIDCGGVFAALYGTWKLIPEDRRHLLKGFVINRFRGDPSILKDSIERIEELTGMRSMGVMPLTDLRFPEEDVFSMEDDEKDPLKNIDAFLTVAEENLDLDGIERSSA